MISFLALNLQVAEASVAMHEMPIATAAKEIAIRQAMAFPFLEDVCENPAIMPGFGRVVASRVAAAHARGGRRRSWNQARYLLIFSRCAAGA